MGQRQLGTNASRIYPIIQEIRRKMKKTENLIKILFSRSLKTEKYGRLFRLLTVSLIAYDDLVQSFSWSADFSLFDILKAMLP